MRCWPSVGWRSSERPVRRGRYYAARSAGARGAYAARIGSLRRVMDLLDFEIDHTAGMVRGRLASDPGYVAVQTIPGIGPLLAAVLVAEIGDIDRFARPEQLTCWAGLTPVHHESDAHVHRGRITKQGSRLVSWAVVRVGADPACHHRDRSVPRPGRGRRGRNIGVVAAARRQLEYAYYALRDHHLRVKSSWTTAWASSLVEPRGCGLLVVSWYRLSGCCTSGSRRRRR
jgi:transposase